MEIEKFTTEEKNEIVRYGIARGKIALMSIIVALVMGYFFQIMCQSIIFLITFWFLRRYAGGYHANSQRICYFISFGAILVSFWCIKYIKCSTIINLLMQTICLLIIFFLSPVENKNRKLTEDERIIYKKKQEPMYWLYLV